MTRFGCLVFLAMLTIGHAAAGLGDEAGMIQAVALNADRPYFVPLHPRVTTTVRFPGEIGAPDGSTAVFTEDATKQAGDYLVTWQPGDSYFTLTPLRDAPIANLNIPFQGRTYVVYVYQVTDPLKAVAAVNLIADGPMAAPEEVRRHPEADTPGGVTRQPAAPPNPFVAATPARLIGFLDRLKLIHATPSGPSLLALATAMKVEIAENSDGSRGVANSDNASICGLCVPPSDAGVYQIVLVRAVRDPRLNCIGFICLVRNTSNQDLVIDVSSFGARAGAEYLPQRVSDATATLKPGEQAPAYFVVAATRNAPLRVNNMWRISVDVVSPRLNPGAMIARAIGGEGDAR